MCRVPAATDRTVLGVVGYGGDYPSPADLTQATRYRCRRTIHVAFASSSRAATMASANSQRRLQQSPVPPFLICSVFFFLSGGNIPSQAQVSHHIADVSQAPGSRTCATRWARTRGRGEPLWRLGQLLALFSTPSLPERYCAHILAVYRAVTIAFSAAS
ncbi:hypothetical protein EDB89DRAFT_264731 [Lactarius sanguifluus]|nr:hypothetical protein EDB89DRAFT_264731 [Lactarius sanguifluus]